MPTRKGTRTITFGRGYGKHKMVVFDLVLVGKGKSFHVETASGTRCGRKGEVRKREQGIDARAVKVGPHVVCDDCRRLLGDIPPPERLVQEQEDSGRTGRLDVLFGEDE